MIIRFMQLNILFGTYLPAIINYVKTHDIDILSCQEVVSGLWQENHVDCFAEIKQKLNYQGAITVWYRHSADHTSYRGNATFFRPSFKLVSEKTIRFNPYREINDMFKCGLSKLPRSSLALVLERDGKRIQIINAHLAWGPTPVDAPYKIKEATTLERYISSSQLPFILSGDFNVTPNTRVVALFNKHARNLTVENQITNTLNPHIHRIKQLFPRGLAVDYIFTSPQLKPTEVRLVDEVDLSDHFGVYAVIEL